MSNTHEEEEEFNATHAYFIGPKGANLPDFRANINTILDELLEARQNYYHEDREFISKNVRRSKKFIEARGNLRLATQKVAQLLGEHSAPFWSPRYEAHMCTDLTMSSLLGYFMTMLYNPNNVALEASPMTTLVELRVGQQLCELFGYNIDTENPEKPLAWGHITCGGTVANLESIWVARNLKFYPLSLFRAITEGKLQFIADKFKVKPCKKDAPEKLFKDLTVWEMQNLRPETVLEIPNMLYDQFGITGKFLEGALEKYNIQTIGRAALEKHFKIDNPMKYFVPTTRHYSWPKGAAIAGLGSGNMVGIDVDYSARIDFDLLKEALLECVNPKSGKEEDRHAVYAVVAVIGSTEEGAVDRLSKILALRKELQDEHGLSFLIHGDAAWGGYFASMLDRTVPKDSLLDGPGGKPHPQSYLDPETVEDLEALQHTDSITVDPHKAGYIPYPSGSLVYRDGRMRHLVTWSSPYLSQGSAENIGVYGVEGSKPGAAAMSAWFSNQTIGLNPRGYGMLLGEATYTSARLSAHYATMINENFICIPFNMLPAEQGGKNDFFSDPVNAQRKRIQEIIIGREDKDVLKDDEAMKILAQLGSDTNINAFALNWKYADGTLNTDLEEANYFMKRVVDKLSITSPNTDPTTIPIYLTSTSFSYKDYGKCKETFMKRIGVQESQQDLFVLRNVVMSPFPSQMNFIVKLMEDLEKEILVEVEKCRERNKPGSETCRFLVQGSPDETVFLPFQTSFHSATRRQQIILTATLDDELRSFYETLPGGDQGVSVVLESLDALDIKKDVVEAIGSSGVSLPFKIFERSARDKFKSGQVHFTGIVKSRPLNSAYRDIHYPEEFVPFYLHGTQKEAHLVHVLTRAPNAYLCANDVKFEPALPEAVTSLLGAGLILGFSELPEYALQPLPAKNKDLPADFFFQKGKEFQVKVWKDKNPAIADGPRLVDNLGEPIYTGKVTLGKDILVDVEGPNIDPFQTEKPVCDEWQEELDKIGSMLDGSYEAEGWSVGVEYR